MAIVDFSTENFETHFRNQTLSADLMTNLKLMKIPDFEEAIRSKIEARPVEILQKSFQEYCDGNPVKRVAVAQNLLAADLLDEDQDARLALALLLESSQPECAFAEFLLGQYVNRFIPSEKRYLTRGIFWPTSFGPTADGPHDKATMKEMFRAGRLTFNPILNIKFMQEAGKNPDQEAGLKRFRAELLRFPNVNAALRQFQANKDIEQKKKVVEWLDTLDPNGYEKHAREVAYFVLEALCIGRPELKGILKLVQKKINESSYAISDNPLIKEQFAKRKGILRKLSRRFFFRRAADYTVTAGVGLGSAALLLSSFATKDTSFAMAATQGGIAAAAGATVYGLSFRRLYWEWKSFARDFGPIAITGAFARFAAASFIALGCVVPYEVTQGKEARTRDPLVRMMQAINRQMPWMPTQKEAEAPKPVKITSAGVAQNPSSGVAVVIKPAYLNDRPDGFGKISIPTPLCARVMLTGAQFADAWEVKVNGKAGTYFIKKTAVTYGWTAEGCSTPDSAYSYDDSLLPREANARRLEDGRTVGKEPVRTMEDRLKGAKQQQKLQR